MAEAKTEKPKKAPRLKPSPAIANWKPAVVIPPKHHICSTKFQGKKPFLPKYLKDNSKSDIGMLLSEEYRRMWFKSLETYYIFEADESQSQTMLKRPFIIRNKNLNMKNRDPKESFVMKRFQGIKSKTDTGLANKNSKKQSPSKMASAPKKHDNVKENTASNTKSARVSPATRRTCPAAKVLPGNK